MPRKSGKTKVKDSFTGFVAHYENGRQLYEKENYFSKKLNKKCATNWAEIDKSRLVKLELFWNGTLKAGISKKPFKDKPFELSPSDWFFSQKGYIDMGTKKMLVIARNIGYIHEGVIHITSVVEKTGIIQKHSRAA